MLVNEPIGIEVEKYEVITENTTQMFFKNIWFVYDGSIYDEFLENTLNSIGIS